MKNKLTRRQMINTELVIRTINDAAAKKLKHHIPKLEQAKLKIAFNCECSDTACNQRIMLTLNQYERLHNNFAHFVTIKGHNEPAVEKIKASSKKITLVEKYALS